MRARHAPKAYRRRHYTKPERRAATLETRRLLRRAQDPDDTPRPPRTGRHRAAYGYW